jgi:hypothetical protein
VVSTWLCACTIATFALKLHAIVVKPLCGVKCLLRRLQIGLRFGLVFGHSRAGQGLVTSLGLIVLALAFVHRGGEIRAFQFGEQLTRTDMIAAIDQGPFHGRTDFRGHVRLIDGIQHGIGDHHMIDRAAYRCLHQNRCRPFGFAFRLFWFRLAASG